MGHRANSSQQLEGLLDWQCDGKSQVRVGLRERGIEGGKRAIDVGKEGVEGRRQHSSFRRVPSSFCSPLHYQIRSQSQQVAVSDCVSVYDLCLCGLLEHTGTRLRTREDHCESMRMLLVLKR